MNASQMVNVVYIGNKERKVDNVANSGVVWHGHGDVKPVSAMQWSQLKLHPQVWALHTEVAQAAALTLGGTAPMPLTVADLPKAGPTSVSASETPPDQADEAKPLEVLLGSDSLPAHIQIGDELVQLGTVIASAQAESGLDVVAWNELVPQIRDKLLVDHIELLRAPADQAAAAAAADAAQGEVSGKIDLSKPPAADSEVEPASSTPPTRRRRGAAAQGEVS